MLSLKPVGENPSLVLLAFWGLLAKFLVLLAFRHIASVDASHCHKASFSLCVFVFTQPSQCGCVCRISLCCNDTSDGGRGSTLITSSYLAYICKNCFQSRSHSQVPVVGILTYISGDTIQPVTLSMLFLGPSFSQSFTAFSWLSFLVYFIKHCVHNAHTGCFYYSKRSDLVTSLPQAWQNAFFSSAHK